MEPRTLNSGASSLDDNAFCHNDDARSLTNEALQLDFKLLRLAAYALGLAVEPWSQQEGCCRDQPSCEQDPKKMNLTPYFPR